MEASGMQRFGNERVRASVLSQDWFSSSNGNHDFGGNESCQSSNGLPYNMKEVENYGPSERENDGHEVEVYGSSSGSGEIPLYGLEMWTMHRLIIEALIPCNEIICLKNLSYWVMTH